jgi:hypothetical protein
LLVLVACVAAGARQPATAAPPSIKLMTPEGGASDYDSVMLSGNWIMIYVHNASPATELFLQGIRREDVPAWNGRVVVIGANLQPFQMKALKLAAPDFPDATWYADPDRKVGPALHLGIAPAVIGMRDKASSWIIAGNLLGQGNRMKPAGSQWIQKEAEMDRAHPGNHRQ